MRWLFNRGGYDMSIEKIKNVIGREPLMVRGVVVALIVALGEAVGVSASEIVESVTGLSVDSLVLAIFGLLGVTASARKKVSPVESV